MTRGAFLWFLLALVLPCSCENGEDGVKAECLCEGPSCRGGERCFGFQCFASLSMLNGTTVFERGCIVEGDEDGPLLCGQPPTAALVVKCCHGHLCNMNVSVQFPVKDVEPSAGRPVLRDQECVCEGDACEHGRRCTGQQCFSSLNVTDRAVVQRKGCLRDDEEGRATCAMAPSSVYVVRCCQGHLCNMNVTVQIPGKEGEKKLLSEEEHECVCEGSSCVTATRCLGLQCFSSLTVSGGLLVHQKGCFKAVEQSTMTCKTPPSREQIVECCQGHLCNMNSTVRLPVKCTAKSRTRH